MLLDIRKAFDTAWRDAIVYKVRCNFGVPKELCRIILAMLRNTKSGIKNDRFVTNIFPATAGVVQGSVISPLLYGVFINDLLTKLQKTNKEADLYTDNLAGLMYCDDIVLMANTKEELEQLVAICEEHSIKWNYRFNPKKCCVLSHNCVDPSMQEVLQYVDNSTKTSAINKEFNEEIPITTRENEQQLIRKPIAPIVITKITNEEYIGINMNGKKD